jgi:hypothetical protein
MEVQVFKQGAKVLKKRSKKQGASSKNGEKVGGTNRIPIY